MVAGTTKLEFTKIKVSDTKLSGDLASMTGIGTIKQEEKVASVVRKMDLMLQYPLVSLIRP